MIAEVCASKLGFSQRSTCRGFSFASLQVGFVVCPRRTAFSRLDMKNISRSILPHLSEGPRCRPKVPAIQARGGKRERHRMMWGAKSTYHICLWLGVLFQCVRMSLKSVNSAGLSSSGRRAFDGSRIGARTLCAFFRS